MFDLYFYPMNKHPEKYEFKYEGDFEGLDTLAVLHTQINFISIVREIKDKTYPEINLDMKMNGLEKGSLDIHHFLEVTAAAGITFMEGHEYIKNIFTILGDIISLKKFLKSSKPDSVDKNGDNITINFNGDNLTIHEGAFSIYQKSPVITNALSNTSQILENFPEIDSVQLTSIDSDTKLVDIQKEDFEDLKTENPYLEKKTDEQVFTDQILYIKKPNLFPEDNKKWVWELIHKGRDIKAVITDPILRKKINNGLRIGQGDRIKASLKIFYKFDERLQTYIESNRYEVNNITEIINRPNPPSELPM